MWRKRLFLVLLLSLFAMATAAMGFVAGVHGASTPPPLLASKAPLAPSIRPGVPPDQMGTPPELEEAFAVFWDVWHIVNTEFYGDVDQQALIRGAIRGMVEALGDPYTQYIDPRHNAILKEDDEGHFEGIGATVDMVDGRLIIVAPMEGSPAERAGLRAGDVVLKIDGRSVEGMDLLDAVALVRGPKGTTVVLTIRREGVPEPFDVPIVRDEIKMASVTSRMLDDEIGYLAIRAFNAQTVKELTAHLAQLEEQGAYALILDLRGNPGGFLDVAVETVSRFVGEGPALWWEDADGRRYPIRVKPRRTYGWPLVVLVDEGSASAAEIVAGALQDAGRAVLVGTRTFGKGSVQNVHQLRDGGSLRVTTAHWLTRDGHPIHGVGLEPDFVVKQDPDRPHRDLQLEYARRLLRKRLTRRYFVPWQ